MSAGSGRSCRKCRALKRLFDAECCIAKADDFLLWGLACRSLFVQLRSAGKEQERDFYGGFMLAFSKLATAEEKTAINILRGKA